MKEKYLTISSKNQITLTKSVREELNAKEGDKVYFSKTSEGIVIRKYIPKNSCPICGGVGKVLDTNCCVCNGTGEVEGLEFDFIMQKVLMVLLQHDASINLEHDKDLKCIIKSKTKSPLNLYYINKWHEFAINKALKTYIKEKLFIEDDFKVKCVDLFKYDKVKQEDSLNKINNTQLEILKDKLRENDTLTQEDIEFYIGKFDEKYQEKVQEFLLNIFKL